MYKYLAIVVFLLYLYQVAMDKILPIYKGNGALNTTKTTQ